MTNNLKDTKMNNLTLYFTLYLVVINLVTFFLFWKDKRRSKKSKWRIPEKTLIGFCLIGGTIGGLAGMYGFHHKTKHALFKLGIPIILVLQLGIAALVV
jgi:uncharacterized membrane protein YsdA (DUF1294 family)